MIPALLIGRGGSTGLPGKNTMKLVGRPLMEYPILAAQHSRCIDKIYLSTDSADIADVGKRLGAEIIERPPYLATKEAKSEDAFVHGFETIKARYGKPVDAIALLFCNGATITPGFIDQGYDALCADPTLDSAVSVSVFNMWSPARARKLDKNGYLVPAIDPALIDGISCDRDTQGDVYYADCSMFVVRPRCMDLSYGLDPFKWIGRKVLPLKQWGGLDIDYDWQVPIVEFWLRKHGFTETTTPYGSGATGK